MILDITHLEEMTIDTDLQICPTVLSKPYPLPFKHHKFVKEEIKNLLEVGLIERSMSPYVASITLVPRKTRPGAPLVETKGLVIDNCEIK